MVWECFLAMNIYRSILLGLMPDIEPAIWPVCCEIVLQNLSHPVMWLDVIGQISLHFHARLVGCCV